jgi:hypothetical protein
MIANFFDPVKLRTTILAFFVFCLIVAVARCQPVYALHCPHNLVEASMDSAAKWVGIKELTGNNDGKEVENFQRHVHLHKGAAWCAAACVTRFDTVGVLPIARSPLALGIWNDAKKRGKFSGVAKVRRGDLIVWQHSAYSGHVVTGVEKVKWPFVTDIEGNTSSGRGNQRDGDGFYRRVRKVGNLGSMILKGVITFQ